MPVALSKKKKITIKPFSKPPKLPPDFYPTAVKKLLECLWNMLERLEGNTLSSSTSSTTGIWTLQQAYTRVVDLVANQYGPQLYQDVVSQCLERATQHVLRDAHQHESLLLYVSTVPYALYVEFLKVVRHVLLPLDRAYAWNVDTNSAVARSMTGSVATTVPSGSTSSSCLPLSLWQISLKLFQQHAQDLQHPLQDAFWKALWDDYVSAGQDTSLDTRRALQSTMHMWHDWNIHHHILHDVLEFRFQQQLQQLAQQYKDRPTYEPWKFLQETYHTQYRHVQRHWTTLLPKLWIQSLLEQYLWETHLNADYLLKAEHLSLTQLDFWQTVWDLGVRVPEGLERVTEALVGHAKVRLQQCLDPLLSASSQSQAPTSTSGVVTRTVEGLLEVQTQLLVLRRALPSSTAAFVGTATSSSSAGATNVAAPTSTTASSSAALLERPLKQLWESVLNEHPARMAEVLAKYMDVVLRSHKRTVTHLHPLLSLFVHLQAKDIFEAFYRKDLAKRLVMEKVQNHDLERQFVSLLKSECGAGYTSKMEGMFQDVEWSLETMTRYKEAILSNNNHANNPERKKKVDMDVKVLTTGYWPVYPQYPLILPESLLSPQAEFLEYYKTKYQGRRVQWQYALGSVDIWVRFDRTYQINMSLCPALVLLCFNEKHMWTLPELQQAVGLQDADEMGRILYNLALGKHRLLVKHDYDEAPGSPSSPPKKPRGTVHPQDTFTVRTNFTSKTLKFRISNLQAKETKEERQKTLETVSRDRLYLIDAVLVRIMKARKTILHQQLIPQVMEQIKVPAQPSDIKLRIESLIEREYMERDSTDRNRYNYLA